MTTAENFTRLAPAARVEVAGALSEAPDSRDARNLRHSPYANRLISLQTSMVPPKVDGTSERVAEIVKGLANQGAIYPDQMGAIHSDLLNRAYTWNSLGVQESIQALVNDVIHGQNRAIQDELGRTKEIANASVLTQFFQSLYQTVDRGQRNFEGFKKLLRLFVNNVPNAEVYSSGGGFSLQINLGGSSQNINLTNAFDNLKDIWGARWDSVNNPRIGALLTPNTRALLFFVSSFYDFGALEPGTYLDNIMRLYKESIKADVDADGDAVMELGEAGANLNKRFEEYKDTLNYLLQNRQYVPPTSAAELSPEQMALLKYLMRQLRQALKDGVPTDVSISTMAQFVEPRLYQTNKVFIERLQDYLLTAQARNPDFYKAIVLDPEWRPPVGLYTGEYVIPDRQEFDLPSEYEFSGPSRDEYFEDMPFQPIRHGLTASQDAQLDRDIAEIMNAFENNLGVQSEAGWIADHRLPEAFGQALDLGVPTRGPPRSRRRTPPSIQSPIPPPFRPLPPQPVPPKAGPSPYDVPLPPPSVNLASVPLPQTPVHMRSLPDTPVHMRSRSSSIASDLGDEFGRLNISGRGATGLFASLKPSVGGNRHTGLAPGLNGTGCGGFVSGRGPPDGRMELLKRVTDPRSVRYGRRLRFY
ncbi:capsid protein precursor pIIIa [Aviadenovirus phalacrocoracidae]|uniref:Capsid protein pIIIa n=1 Tax=Aviadenovirus sp. TaxID=2217649 RepID=A0ABZ0T6C6_9ADEN|nr:capsid protein precursor pIIIa [Aviadenovirus sp.]